MISCLVIKQYKKWTKSSCSRKTKKTKWKTEAHDKEWLFRPNYTFSETHDSIKIILLPLSSQLRKGKINDKGATVTNGGLLRIVVPLQLFLPCVKSTSTLENGFRLRQDPEESPVKCSAVSHFRTGSSEVTRPNKAEKQSLAWLTISFFEATSVAFALSVLQSISHQSIV